MEHSCPCCGDISIVKDNPSIQEEMNELSKEFGWEYITIGATTNFVCATCYQNLKALEYQENIITP